jgi:hypothetical protein
MKKSFRLICTHPKGVPERRADHTLLPQGCVVLVIVKERTYLKFIFGFYFYIVFGSLYIHYLRVFIFGAKESLQTSIT